MTVQAGYQLSRSNTYAVAVVEVFSARKPVRIIYLGFVMLHDLLRKLRPNERTYQ